MITDEKVIQTVKDEVEDFCLNKGLKITRSDIYLLSFKSNDLRNYFNIKLGVRGYTDIFILKIDTLKNKMDFKHYEFGDSMYIGSGY